MPCTFDTYERVEAPLWRSRDSRLTPASSWHFHVITGNRGGGCGYCGDTQQGVAWGCDSYVLCLRCASAEFGAPDLHRYAPELFDPTATPPSEDDLYVDDPEMPITKRDKDFDPRKYKVYVHRSALTGYHGCAGYRCQTYAMPGRTIPANAEFMLGEGQRGNLCMPCFAKLKAKWDAVPDRVICPHCERRILSRNMTDVIGYRHPRVCKTCRDEYFMECRETDRGYVWREGIVYVTIPGTATTNARHVYASPRYAERHWFMGREQWYMTEAEADREMFSIDTPYRDRKIAEHAGQTIFSYGTNVIKMYGFPEVTPKDSLCFGVELEIQPGNNHTHEQLVDALGGKYAVGQQYILCRDSSVPNGAELITLPYTLANHKADVMPWTKVLERVRKVGKSGMGTTQCGMHVHINRRALSHLQMGKMLVVINAPEMQELIATVAQRSEASYCQRYFKKVADGGKIVGSHGDALNCGNRKGTLELRIFRGNLRYERVMKNLEFTDALCNYAAEQSIQKVHIPEAFVGWMKDNKKHYPHLVKFVEEEYTPTKAFARHAAAVRAKPPGSSWAGVVGKVHIEPTEGDI